MEIWVQRDLECDPIIDLVIINESKDEQIPFGFSKVCNIDNNQNIDISLNEGASHRDKICLCYKTRNKQLDNKKRNELYEPKIIDRYPLKDYDEFPLTENVAPFCFPRGMDIIPGKLRKKQHKSKIKKKLQKKRNSIHKRSSAEINLNDIMHMNLSVNNDDDNPSIDDLDLHDKKQENEDDENDNDDVLSQVTF